MCVSFPPVKLKNCYKQLINMENKDIYLALGAVAGLGLIACLASARPPTPEKYVQGIGIEVN